MVSVRLYFRETDDNKNYLHTRNERIETILAHSYFKCYLDSVDESAYFGVIAITTLDGEIIFDKSDIDHFWNSNDSEGSEERCKKYLAEVRERLVELNNLGW